MILHELSSTGWAIRASRNKFAGRDHAHFGSYERWRAEFIAMGKALGGGSGWVLAVVVAARSKLVNQWAYDHCQTLAGGRRSWRSICTSIPITSTSARKQQVTSILS